MRRDRDRGRLPGTRPLQRARARSGHAAARARCCCSTTSTWSMHTRRSGRRPRPSRESWIKAVSLRPRRLRHEVAGARAGAGDRGTPEEGHRAGVRHPLSRRSGRGARTEAGARAGFWSTGRSWFSGVAQVLNEGGTTESHPARVRSSGGSRRCRRATRSRSSRRRTSPRSKSLCGKALEENSGSTPVGAAPSRRHGIRHARQSPTPPLTDLLRHLDRVRADPAELAILPDRYGSFLEPRADWSPLYRHPGCTRSAAGCTCRLGASGVGSRRPTSRRSWRTPARAGSAVWSHVIGRGGAASPYPTPVHRPLQARDRGALPGSPFRSDSDLRRDTRPRSLPRPGDSDVRLLADPDEHHRFRAPPRQRREDLPARLPERR